MTYQITDEQLLQLFGQWLREMRAAVEHSNQDSQPPQSPGTEHVERDRFAANAGSPTIETMVGLCFAGPALPPAQLETRMGLDQDGHTPNWPVTADGWDQRDVSPPVIETMINSRCVGPVPPPTPLETPTGPVQDDRAPRQPGFEEPAQDVGIYRLVEEFTALRHELKLQTKSARGLEEQAQTLLPSLGQAIDAMRSIEPKQAQASWSTGRPLAAILADLDEALDRGRLQTEMAIARLSDEPASTLLNRLDKFQQQQSSPRRLLHGRYHQQICELIALEQQQLDRRAWLDALLDGYRLIQRRLAHALASEGINRIVTVGQPVDPEQMMVVQVVDTDDHPAGMVFDEVRRGYTWNGRLLRCAEVRATRAAHSERCTSHPTATPGQNNLNPDPSPFC